MAQAHICDKCGKILKFASDCKIKIYVHPYGDNEYELCNECKEKLKKWLGDKTNANSSI